VPCGSGVWLAARDSQPALWNIHSQHCRDHHSLRHRSRIPEARLAEPAAPHRLGPPPSLCAREACFWVVPPHKQCTVAPPHCLPGFSPSTASPSQPPNLPVPQPPARVGVWILVSSSSSPPTTITMAFVGSTVTGVAGARAPTKQICSVRRVVWAREVGWTYRPRRATKGCSGAAGEPMGDAWAMHCAGSRRPITVAFHTRTWQRACFCRRHAAD